MSSVILVILIDNGFYQTSQSQVLFILQAFLVEVKSSNKEVSLDAQC